MARSPEGWHPEDIKAQLRKRFGPITSLSLEWGYARNAITNTLGRPDYSQRIEGLIAAALQTPLHVLWPRRWQPNGSPLPRTSERNRISPSVPAERQNQRAA